MEVRSLEAIVTALNTAGVDYLIVGGLAVNAHGFVRLTRGVGIVIRLSPDNAAKGLNTLLGLGYQMSIPEKPEAFADAATREKWRREKQMIVLKLWSDEHRRTPIDIFVYEPFSFREELARSSFLEISPGVVAPVVSLPTLLEMKRIAGRSQDLIESGKIRMATCKFSFPLCVLIGAGRYLHDMLSDSNPDRTGAFDDQMGLTGQKIVVINPVYVDALCIQNAARLECPANKTAPTLFLLEGSPPRDYFEPSGGTQTPAPMPSTSSTSSTPAS